jgi:hypothetical protein
MASRLGVKRLIQTTLDTHPLTTAIDLAHSSNILFTKKGGDYGMMRRNLCLVSRISVANY